MTRAELEDKIARWRVVIDRGTSPEAAANELVHAVDLLEGLASLVATDDLADLDA